MNKDKPKARHHLLAVATTMTIALGLCATIELAGIKLLPQGGRTMPPAYVNAFTPTVAPFGLSIIKAGPLR